MPSSIQSGPEVLEAAIGKALPVAYGRHIVAGNVVLRQDDEIAQQSYLWIALGEGEWDAPEEIIDTGKTLVLDTDYHWHPGTAGQPGTGGSGTQQVDPWFPAGLEGLAFSHTAHIVVKHVVEVASAGPDIDIRGRYRCLKVQKYSSLGVPDGPPAWSDNPAWCALDAVMNTRYGLGLPATYVDFAAVTAWAAYCDTLIQPVAGGPLVKRFVGNVAFAATVNFAQGFEQLLAAGRGYALWSGSKLELRPEQPRAKVFDLGLANISESSFRRRQANVLEQPNQFRLTFRDTDANYATVTKKLDDEARQQALAADPLDPTRTRALAAEVELAPMPSHQAMRLGLYFLRRQALEHEVELAARWAAFGLEPGDVVGVTHDEPAWAGKLFEVIDAADDPDGERQFRLLEYAESVFTDSADPAQPPVDTSIADESATDPLTVGGFVITPRPDGLEIEWMGNREVSLIRYDLYRSATPLNGESDYTDAKIVASIPHGGRFRPHRIFYPISATAGAFYYGIKAANAFGRKSFGTADVNPHRALAPDGTTDYGIPSVGPTMGWSVPAPDGSFVFMVYTETDTLHRAGITRYEIVVSYTGGDGAGSKRFGLATPLGGHLEANPTSFRFAMANATITQLVGRQFNSFGASPTNTASGLSLQTGTQVHDIEDPPFNPGDPRIGPNRVRARSSQNLQLDATTSGFTVDVLKKLKATAEVETSAVRAASGDLTLDAGAGGQIKHAKIADFSANSHYIKSYSQLTRPTLAQGEWIFWDNGRSFGFGWHAGMLGYNSTMGPYIWFRRTDTDDTIHALLNPVDGDA